MKKITHVWNASEFIWSDEWRRISANITTQVRLLETSLFPKWVKAIYNYCMYTWDRIENLLMKGYSKKEIAKMSDYFHPMVYRIINTMYGYLFDANFIITVSGGDCGTAAKIQKNAEWYWRQKYVFKNMMRIIKQSILIGQCRWMPYVELVFKPWSTKNKKWHKYLDDYVTAGLHKVSPFHLFYDPHISWEEQEEVTHCRFTTLDKIKQELDFMTFWDWKTKVKNKVNYISKEEVEYAIRSWDRFCTYDFSRVRQVWRQQHHNGSTADAIARCLSSDSFIDLPSTLDNYKIEKNNEILERTLCFRRVEGERRLAVFLNKVLIYEGCSPYGNQLPYVPLYYKEPMEGSVERGMWVLLEKAQEVTNNAYRAKNDSIRKNAINGSITVVQWSGTIKKNGKSVNSELVLQKDDVIQVGKDVKLSNLPVANVNQDYPSLIQDANALGDYIANLNNVTWWQSGKITRVAWEVISKTQVTQRELEPIVLGIEEFITCITEIIFEQIATKVNKKYQVFISGETFDIDIDDLKARYTYKWSTSRIDELYREYNAQKKEVALNLILQSAPELINREEWAREAACLGWLSDKIIMTPGDAAKFRLKEQRDIIKMEKELLQDQLELEQERARLFPPAQPWPVEQSWLQRTNVNINYKDISNPTVRQEILAEAGAESALEIDPNTLLPISKDSVATNFSEIAWQWLSINETNNVVPTQNQVIDLAEV